MITKLTKQLIAFWLLVSVFISCSKEDGSDTKPKIDPPSVDFNISEISGIEPLLVEFENLSKGNNLKYSWDFGDGETSTEVNPKHIYDSVGSFQVQLIATDIDEQTGLAKKEIQVISRISNDEAIRNTDLPLVLIAGMQYENIKPRVVVTNPCNIERLMEPLIPERWESLSMCEREYDADSARMKAYIYSGVYPKWQIPQVTYNVPYFREQTSVTYSMKREFSVAGDTIDGKVVEKNLTGSNISFDLRWLGRLVAGGPLGYSKSKIEFFLWDVTNDSREEYKKFDESSVSATLKMVTFYGVSLPVTIPGWQKNEAKIEPYNEVIPIITGHEYFIRLDLTLETKSDVIPLFDSWADFKQSGIFDLGIGEEGYIQWLDVVIEVGT